MSTGSIHKRLAEIHKNLMNINIPKTGRNPHKKFTYHELEDIMPYVIKECYEHEITLEFTFVENTAILKLVDWLNPKEYIPFRINVPELIIPEKNPNNKLIQDTGANITYLQRYLLKLAFPCISDKDTIDMGINDDDASSANETKKSSAKKKSKKEPETVREDLNLQDLLDKAFTTLQKKGLTHEEITAFAVKKCIQKMDKFNKKELNLIYDFVNEYFKDGASQ